jgi:hypothetical protein
MTPEQIHEAAIEAGAKAHFEADNPQDSWDAEDEWLRDSFRRCFRAAIAAYEKAMWTDADYLQPHHGNTVLIKCTSGRTGVAICVWERASDVPQWHWADVGLNEPNFTNRVVPAHFRPLPQPLEVK